MKISYKLIFLFIFIQSIFLTNASAQDLALHKAYVLTPLPNYTIRTKAALDTILTDGRYSKGTYFWSQPTTLGWVKMPEVKISIDLGTVNKISAVTFNTCQRVDSFFNVRYPDHIFIFLSKDSIHYWYAGDAVSDTGNLPGPYQIKDFTLGSINQQARYVVLSVVPNGHLLFCDEISVTKGHSKDEQPANIFDIGLLDKTVNSLVSANFNRNYLLGINNSALYNTSVNQRKSVSNNIVQLKDYRINLRNLQSVDSLTRAVHLNGLREKFKNDFIIAKVMPWDSITPFQVPQLAIDGIKYQFLLPGGGTGYGAFTITNLNKVSQQFNFKNSFSGENATTDLFNA